MKIFVFAFLFLLPCVLGDTAPEARKGKAAKCPKLAGCKKNQVNCGAPPMPVDAPAPPCPLAPLCLDKPLTKKDCPKNDDKPTKKKAKKGKKNKKAKKAKKNKKAKKAKKSAKKSA